MALTLYVGSKRYSSWSLRPYLALAHTGQPFDTKTILLDQAATKAEILAVNAAGKVPVLHHDQLVVWDSLAICEYAAELSHDAKLWPTERSARARARSASAEMHAGFAALRRDMPMDVCAKKPTIGHTPEALADANRVKALWGELLSASGGPFLFGSFTIADAMYAPVATRFLTYDVELDPASRSYVDALYALPALKQWIDDAGREPQTRA
jgi:glutathione S-transferase